MRPFISLAGILWCVLLAGCGYVGEPLYPALNIATRVGDLAAVERGSSIEVSFTIAPLTTDGLALKNIGGIELRVGPAADGGSFQAENWAKTAHKVDVPTPSMPGAVRTRTDAQPFLGKTVVLGVRVANAKGRLSDWSNFVALAIQPPLPTPLALTVAAVTEGIQLRWNGANEPKFRIYRRAGAQVEPSLLGTSDMPEYLDKTTEYGERYEYYVQGLNGVIESAVAGPVAVTAIDTFAPAVPTNVSASAAVSTVELAWERNTETDFKDYRVYRAVADGPFEQVADGVQTPSYSDSHIEPGKRYRYRVTAVDQTGNESAPSEVVEVTVP